jgi:peroxiredoxin
MQLPDFDLPTVAGGYLSAGELLGRPWFAYLSRHTGCYVCQFHLRQAVEVRPQIQQLGGDLLVFFPARLEHVRTWHSGSGLPSDLQVVVDPETELYDALGTRHGNLLHHAGRSVREMWQARGHLPRWRLTGADMTRMGADLAIAPDGSLAVHHVCETPGDRADPLGIVEALRQTVAEPAAP